MGIAVILPVGKLKQVGCKPENWTLIDWLSNQNGSKWRTSTKLIFPERIINVKNYKSIINTNLSIGGTIHLVKKGYFKLLVKFLKPI